MSHTFRFAVLAGFLTLLLACGGGEALQTEHAEKDAAMDKARVAAKKLTSTLLGEVQRTMKEGGPVAAVRHCAEYAQTLSEEVAETEGVEIRRVTTKTRNPVDAPDAYESEVLRHFGEVLHNSGAAALQPHAEVQTMNGVAVLRYMKPITIKKPCLSCHGPSESLAQDVRTVLEERYPADEATGYSLGDLRGAISVIVLLDKKE